MRGTPIAYYVSLNRPFLIAGVDRGLFFLFLGLCLPIAYSGHLSPMMDMIALLSFCLLHAIGMMITKTDSQILAVFRRHIRYHRYYSAIAQTQAPIPLPGMSVPFVEGQKRWL